METGETTDFGQTSFDESTACNWDDVGERYEVAVDVDWNHGQPEGSLPSVSGPRPVSQHGDTETYALGGKPGAKAAPWLIKAQRKAMAKSDAKAANQKKNK